jgi:hypothetical protein
VTIKLSAKALHKLRGRRSVRVLVKVTAHNRARARVTLQQTVPLKLPRQ